MIFVEITPDALGILTAEQAKAIAHLNTEHTMSLRVFKGSFDLPEGYLSFSKEYMPGYGTGNPLYGGIDSEGRIST